MVKDLAVVWRGEQQPSQKLEGLYYDGKAYRTRLKTGIGKTRESIYYLTFFGPDLVGTKHLQIESKLC